MTFTYNTNPFDDIARIRFAIGDTDSEAAIFSDEVLNGLITENSDDWQRAAIAATENIITQLLVPGFTADWLKVDSSKAVQGYERLLERLKAKYADAGDSISVSASLPTRIDGDS